MEDNKNNPVSETPLIESGSITGNQEKIRKIGAYIIVTVTFFLTVSACIFSEIGYDMIKDRKNYLMLRFEEQSIEHLIESFFGVDKLHKLEKPKDTSSIPDEPLTENSENNLFLPVEAETEIEEETNPILPTEETTDIKYPVIALDLSQKHLGENYIVNETGYTPDIEMLKNSNNYCEALEIEDTEQPVVLIIHTHGTESYLEEGKEFYTENEGEISRTNDTSKNMVKIGKIIADILNEGGIKTLHCEILHDEKSYQDSYTRAAESIKSYLAKYPSIKYVFDVHRDAILKSDGSLIKASTEINGESIAQVMTVVGSDYKGADFSNWETNLAAALKLKKILDENAPSVSRPVYLRGAAYNQQFSPCSLLLEIGTSGNTLKEAEEAAAIVAKALLKLIEELSVKH